MSFHARKSRCVPSLRSYGGFQSLQDGVMNITECFPMRKRRSIDKTPGRSHDNSALNRSPPVSRLRRTPRRLGGSSCNNSLLDQSLEIVWDNNSPSPTRFSHGKRKKHHGSDSSSSGGEISDLVQKLADKSGSTPEANPPLLALWMSRENNTSAQANRGYTSRKGDSSSGQKIKEFQTPSRRSRRLLRKCNKSKMKLLKQDLELLVLPAEKTEEEATIRKESSENSSEMQQKASKGTGEVNHGVKVRGSESLEVFENWDTDEDDLILSQIEIPVFKNAIPETQVMTSTQFLSSGGEMQQNNELGQPPLTRNHRINANVDTIDSIVTESWDFVNDDTDDDYILQTALEDVEKSQQVTIPTVRRVPQLYIKPDMLNVNEEKIKDLCGTGNALVKNKSDITRSKDQCFRLQNNPILQVQSTRKRDHSFVHHSSLQSSTTLQTKKFTTTHQNKSDVKITTSVTLPQKNLQRAVQQHTICQEINTNNQEFMTPHSNKPEGSTQRGSKTAKYSKEEIERKKLAAQCRRRQKMAQLSELKQ